MAQSIGFRADHNTKSRSVWGATIQKLVRSYSLIFPLLLVSLSSGVAGAAAPQWATDARDALQDYKFIVDYWIDRAADLSDAENAYHYFNVPNVPLDPINDPEWIVAERWNDDVELAQSLAAYWLLTGDQPLADMFRDMAIKIQDADTYTIQTQAMEPWIQPGDTRIEQAFTTYYVDPEHSAEETTLVFPRLTYVDFGEPTAIELITRLIWNFQDNVPAEQNWARPMDTGFLMRSPAYNARNLAFCWPHVYEFCDDPTQDPNYPIQNPGSETVFLPQDTIGNFRTTAPGLSLLWYYGPSHYFWQTNNFTNGFMWGHNNAWIDASQRTDGGKLVNIPPAKVFVDESGNGNWQGYGDWTVNDNNENVSGNSPRSWNNNQVIFRHFYHALAGQMIGTGAANDASDIVGTAYTMRQNGNEVVPGVYMAFDRQFLQWRPEINDPGAYSGADQNLINNNSWNITPGSGDSTSSLTKNAYKRMLAARLNFDNYINSGQSTDFTAAVDRAADVYKIIKQILANEKTDWTTNLGSGGTGVTDQVKFEASDAFLVAAVGGSGIYDGAYPSMLVSWNDTDGEVASLVLDRNPSLTRLWVWNFGSQPEVGLRLWRITEGVGQLRIGPDANQDGTMDLVTQTIALNNIRKGTEVRFTLPTSTDLQLIEIDVTTTLTPPRDLTNAPDPAIGYKDITCENGLASVTVHNIGIGATSSFNARLFDTNGDEIGSAHPLSLAGFAGMDPVTTTLNWTIPQGRQVGCVILDQENVIANEITELNNYLLVQSLSSSCDTARLVKSCDVNPPATTTTSTTTTSTTTTSTTTTMVLPSTTTTTLTTTISTTTTVTPTTTTTTTTTTLPPITSFEYSYYILNPLANNGDMTVVSLVDNNTIGVVGGTSVVLNKNQSGVLPKAELIQKAEITGTGPFSISGSINGTDMPVPASFKAKEFVIPHDGSNNHDYYIYSPDADADVTIQNGSFIYNTTILQGDIFVYGANGTSPKGGLITSTVPVLILHQSDFDDFAFPVPPPAMELWGVRSGNVKVCAQQDGTNITVVASDGSNEIVSLDAGRQYSITVGSSQSQGRGSALYISANQPIAAIQTDDGAGNDATAFWSAEHLGTQYGIPVDSTYVAVVCPEDNTTVTLTNTNGATINNLVCNRANPTNPGKAYYGVNNGDPSVGAVSIVESDKPIFVIHDASEAPANSFDEHNLKGMLTSPHHYYILNPLANNGDMTVVSLVDNNTIGVVGGTSVVLNKNQSGVLPKAELIQKAEITGTGPFSISGSINGTDMPVPASFKAKEFVIPHDGSNNHDYYIYSPDADADVTIQNGSFIYNTTILQGDIFVYGANGTSPKGGLITSTVPVLILHQSDFDDFAFPVPPPAMELWGVRSGNVKVCAQQDGTNITVVASDGSNEIVSLDAGRQYSITVGSSQSQGRGSALYISANQPIAAIQTDDGAGNDATAFWSAEHLGTQYGIPVDSTYVAVVCPEDNTTVTLTNTNGATINNLVCNRANPTNPGKAYYGVNNGDPSVGAVSIVESDKPIFVIHDASEAPVNSFDEHNLKGMLLGTFQDSDGDGLTNYYEACYDGDCLNYDPYDPVTGTGGDLNATVSDTDQDSVDDDIEISAGTDPLDPLSSPGEIVPGDINNDGQVNVADILLAQRHVLGLAMLSPDQISRGDVYPAGGDGLITLPDLLLIQKISLSLP